MVDCCRVEITVTSKGAGRPSSSRGGRCQQVGSGSLEQERELPFRALRQLTGLLKKLHPEENYDGEFCHSSLHIPLNGPQRGWHQLDIQGTQGPPQTFGVPANTANRNEIPGRGDEGPGQEMERH